MRHDLNDIIGGSLLAVTGLGAVIYAVAFYPIGTISRMGSGFFPLSVGMILAVLGVILVITGASSKRDVPVVEVVPLVSITGGFVLFTLLIERLGVVPAVMALVAVMTVADRRLNWFERIALGIGLSAACVGIFVWLIGMPVRPFEWRL